MSTSGWHGRLGVVLAFGATLAVAAPAGAATTVRLASGTTSLKLDGKTAKAIKKAGVKVSAAKPAKSKGGSFVFTISGGSIDPATAKGTIAHKGGLTFTMGRGKVTLANPSIDTTKGTLSATIGKKAVAVGTAKGGKVTRDGFATNVAGLKLALNKRGAQTLNSAFGVRAFKSGAALGTAAVASQPAEIAIESGTTQLVFTQGAAGALRMLGVAVTPIAPATLDAATGALTFTVTGGLLDAKTHAGKIEASGGLSLAAAGASPVQLTSPIVNLGGTPQLAVTYSGLSTPIADLDLSAAPAKIDPATRAIEVAGASAKLNFVAATTLNQLFGLREGGPFWFRAGDELVTASLTAKAR